MPTTRLNNPMKDIVEGEICKVQWSDRKIYIVEVFGTGKLTLKGSSSNSNNGYTTVTGPEAELKSLEEKTVETVETETPQMLDDKSSEKHEEMSKKM